MTATNRFVSEYRILARDQTMRGTRSAIRNMQALDRQNLAMSKRARGMTGEFAAFTRQFIGFYAVMAGGSALTATLNSLDSISNRLRALTGFDDEVTRLRHSLMDLAQDTRQSFHGVSTFYSRLAFAMRDTTYTSEDLLGITKTLNKLMTASGTTSVEASAAMIQYSQALASGRLAGEEYRSISEQTPIVLDAIAKYLGVTRKEIQKLAKEQKLTTDVNIAALKAYEDEAEILFNLTHVTMAQGWTMVKNAAIEYVDGINSAIGGSKNLGKAMAILADNMTLVMNLMLGAGGTVAGIWAWDKGAKALTGSMKGLRRAILPFLAIEAALYTFTLWTDTINSQIKSVRELTDEYVKLRETQGQLSAANLPSLEKLLKRAETEYRFFKKAVEGEIQPRKVNAWWEDDDKVVGNKWVNPFGVGDWKKRMEDAKKATEELREQIRLLNVDILAKERAENESKRKKREGDKDYMALVDRERYLTWVIEHEGDLRLDVDERIYQSRLKKSNWFNAELIRRHTHEHARRREMAEAAAKEDEKWLEDLKSRKTYEYARGQEWLKDDAEMEARRTWFEEIIRFENQAQELIDARNQSEEWLHEQRMRRMDELRGANVDEARFERSMIKKKAAAESAFLEGMYNLRSANAGKSIKLARAVALVEGMLQMKKAIASANEAFAKGLANPPGPPWSYGQAFLALASGLAAAAQIGSAFGIGGGVGGAGGVSGGSTAGSGTGIGVPDAEEAGPQRNITIAVKPGHYDQQSIVSLIQEINQALGGNDDTKVVVRGVA